MENVILRTNAIPVYGFLSFIHARHPQGETSQRGKVLDCGAGGPVPPLGRVCKLQPQESGRDDPHRPVVLTTLLIASR
jgi:hypothetical protein